MKLEAALKEARLQRAIEKEKAETEAQAQKVLAEAVDGRAMKLRELEIEKMKAEAQLAIAKGWKGEVPGSVTIMGGAAGQNPNVMFGLPLTK